MKNMGNQVKIRRKRNVTGNIYIKQRKTDSKKAVEAVKEAVKAGYRLIDTAQAYGNERGVGEGIRTGGVQREELFVVSKVAAGHKTYEDKCRGFPVYDGNFF